MSSTHHRNQRQQYWNESELVSLPIGIADFGLCQDIINNRIYICGGLDSQFKSLSESVMYDIQTNKWINLPKLNLPPVLRGLPLPFPCRLGAINNGVCVIGIYSIYYLNKIIVYYNIYNYGSRD